MLLIGMFDSPYVRRVAMSLHVLDLKYEHANWSIGKDIDRVTKHNPLGQVPTLVLDDGEALIDSMMILDYLDQIVGPARALVPASGEPRRRVHQLMALATGLADKARTIGYERFFRPAEKRHEPVVTRLDAQMRAAAAALEAASVARGAAPWFAGDALTQADITLVAALTYAHELTGFELPPSLRARHDRLAEQPWARATYVRFDPPVIS
jgi:glutathione S-transferase